MSTRLATTAHVVDWVTSLTADDLPEAVRRRAGDALLHHAYCGGQGQRLAAPSSAIAALGTHAGTVPAIRALVDGVSAHATLQEDMHVSSVAHIGTVVLPTALAAAGGQGSGSDLLVAIAGGYEVMGRVGTVLARTGLAARLRPTGTFGPVGAWAAAARMYHLDAAASARALGLAVNAAAGLNGWAWHGGEEVFLHAGQAAQAGINAALLARAGFAGSPDGLTGRNGYLPVLGGPDAVDWLGEQRWGDPWVLEEILFKPHPACNYAQTVIDACASLRGLADIVEIEVGVSVPAKAYPGCDAAGPWPNRLAAQMSIQFAAVATLLDGDYLAALDAGPSVWSSRYAELASRVRVVVDPEIDARYPEKQGARVRVRTGDGGVVEASRDDFGALTVEQVRDNVLGLGKRVGVSDAAERLVEFAANLTQVSAASAVAEAVHELWSAAAKGV